MIRKISRNPFSLRLLLALLSVLVAPSLSFGVIAHQSTYGGHAGTGTGRGTISWSHTVSSGPNKILIVTTAINLSPAASVTQVTFNGSLLTRKAKLPQNSAEEVQLWYMLDPPEGTSDVTVTFSGNHKGFEGRSTVYSDVSQYKPFSNVTTAGGNSAGPASVTIKSNAGELVIDGLAYQNGGTMTPDPTQTSRYSQSDSYNGQGASEKAGSFPDVTMNWSLQNSDTWAVVAASLRPAKTPAVRRVTVRPSCAGHGDCYTSLNAAIQGEVAYGNLVTLDRQLDIELYAMSDSTKVDLTPFNGMTDPDHFIRIYTPSSERHNGVWDASKYRLETAASGSNTECILVGATDVWFDGIQVNCSGTCGSRYLTVMSFEPGATPVTFKVSNSVLKGTFTGVNTTANTNAFRLVDFPATSEGFLWNNLVYDLSCTGNSSTGRMVHTAKVMSGDIYVYNSTLVNANRGLVVSGTKVHVRNSIAQQITGSAWNLCDSDSDYNITNRNETITGSHSKYNAIVSFLDVPNKDFRLSPNDSVARNAGINTLNAPSTNYGLDIEGQARDAVWDIGADECVDVTPPDTMISDKPADPATSASATFSFTSTEPGSTFRCRLDNSGESYCASPVAYSFLSEGIHTFSVQAVDATGNADPTPDTCTWTIDTGVPNAPFVSGRTPTNETRPAWTWTTGGGGNGTYRYQIDSEAETWSSETDVTTFTPAGSLAEGGHALYVQERNSAGNWSVSGSRTITVDTSAPASAITAPTGGSVMATALSVQGTASDIGSMVAKVEISVNGGAWTQATGTTSWSYTLAVPSDGTFIVQSRATDTAGNSESPGSGILVTVYKRGPTAAIINAQQLTVNGKPFVLKGVVYSPVPIGDDPLTAPYGDYFTPEYADLYFRDLPLLRQMGANAIRLVMWESGADHHGFLDQAYNGGVNPIYVIPGFWINPGWNIDPASTGNVREQLKADFREMVAAHKNHPAILMWAIGSELNSPAMYGAQLGDLFSLLDEMASGAHAEEGAASHPVTTPLSDSDLVGTIANYEASVPSLDVWGVNIYEGSTFGAVFNDYKTVSNKPLVVLEYGIDTYDTVHGNEYEYIGQAFQADYAASLWKEIAGNSDVCIGGTIMEYSDEWWKGVLSSDGSCFDNDTAYHGLCGYAITSHPDGYSNEEWWGIMETVDNGAGPDVMLPRAIYYRLQSLWRSSMTINNAAAATKSISVTLALTCNDDTGCAQMQFSNDNAIWSAPVTYAATRAWTLSTGDGVKTVYAKVKDPAGNWSNVFSDTIVLDTKVPVTAASPAGGAYNSSPTVTLTCGDGTGSGCDKIYYTIDGTTPTKSSSVYPGPLTMSVTTTLKYFAADLAGNSETVKTQTYTIDTIAPTGSTTINNDAAYNKSISVTLALTCSDNTSCAQMQFSNDNAIWSAPVTYAATRAWTLSTGDGVKTVYAKVKDPAGNWSNVFSDTIVLDTKVPVTAASPAGGAYNSSPTVTLTCGDGTGSGCDKVYYTIDGTTPTKSSSVYPGPLTMSVTTTLKYFATDFAGNSETVKTQTYTIDTVAPLGSMTINNDATSTKSISVTLALTCSDNTSCAQMQFSNDNAIWSAPVTYAATRAWTLSTGDGVKTVYAKVKDPAGNWSNVFSDTIVLDTKVPVTAASPAGGAYNSSPTVTLTCGDGTGSGCDKVYYTIDGTTPTKSSSIYSGPLTMSVTTTLKYFAADLAGNNETVKTQTYTIDTIAPTGSTTINNDTAYTKSISVTLALTCSDNTGCAQMQFSNDNAIWSTPVTYAATRAWTLSTGDGAKTVYAKVKDPAGNWSEIYSDSISLDMTAPVNGLLTAAVGTAQAELNWSGFLDTTSGIAGYKLVYNTTNNPGSCSTGAVIYSGAGTSYVHTGLTSGVTYYYRICATDNAGNVSSGAITTAKP